ncbi:uncharacterized protein K444DRAFT_664166 [Hyaloscypha bicolor E]|uniref:Uncharacterized protein n=1 Tax=Hyaloscypha bicolor E TaxID=1095630 RepID=A0A2J6T7J6_9HELO|nr:uncharacterized protein K444DRAFT_664166 [Hyaloscypha bicolor E]PMD58987.1 hypothetical protein K444DRAFT_664166 [Hyaloscypha bicolor E]
MKILSPQTREFGKNRGAAAERQELELELDLDLELELELELGLGLGLELELELELESAGCSSQVMSFEEGNERTDGLTDRTNVRSTARTMKEAEITCSCNSYGRRQGAVPRTSPQEKKTEKDTDMHACKHAGTDLPDRSFSFSLLTPPAPHCTCTLPPSDQVVLDWTGEIGFDPHADHTAEVCLRSTIKEPPAATLRNSRFDSIMQRGEEGLNVPQRQEHSGLFLRHCSITPLYNQLKPFSCNSLTPAGRCGYK